MSGWPPRLGATLAIVAGCKASDPPPTMAPPPELVLYEIREHARGACIAEVPGRPAYAFPCNETGAYATIGNVRHARGEDVERIDMIAALPDGTCHTRAESCTRKDCLGERVPCPPDRATPIRAPGWRIVEEGDACRAVPLPATPVSEPGPPVAYPCPTGRTTGIRRRSATECVEDNWVGRPPRDTSRDAAPPIPVVVPCPG